jgi:hypothetical protein
MEAGDHRLRTWPERTVREDMGCVGLETVVY